MKTTENLPDEVQEMIDILDLYSLVDQVDEINCIHMYPDKIAFPDGYHDSRFFRLIGFSFKNHEKVDLGLHDAIGYNALTVCDIRIYADGSTFLAFPSDKPVVRVKHGQRIELFQD